MLRKLIPILCLITISLNIGCAWENLPEGEVIDQKIIQVTMKLGGAMHEDLFYYIVFNLSGDLGKKPYSIFDGEDRGKYWTVYYMYGAPPYRDRGLYRGLGGISLSGNVLIDQFPKTQDFATELLPGTNVQGDSMTLKIDLTELPLVSDIVNLNMIVCNQAIDAESKFEYEYEPYVFDSFMDRGLSIDIGGHDSYWSEAMEEYKQELFPNEHEDTAPPEADIIHWNFQVITN